MEQHEDAFVRAFVVRAKRSRYHQFLASPKRQREILDRLNHGNDIDLSCATLLSASLRAPAQAEALLRQRGAGARCHVIADGLAIDGQEMPLREALAEADRHEFAVVLSCIPGRLVLYKEEAPGEWWLLERPFQAAAS